MPNGWTQEVRNIKQKIIGSLFSAINQQTHCISTGGVRSGVLI